MLIGADGRHMHKARATSLSRLRDLRRAIHVNGFETLTSALEQDAHEVDKDFGVAGSGLDRRRVPDVRLHGVDLSHSAERLQMAGEFGSPHRNPDAIMTFGKSAHYVPPEKAGASVDGYERVIGAACGHAAFDPARGNPLKLGQYRIGKSLYRGWQSRSLTTPERLRIWTR